MIDTDKLESVMNTILDTNMMNDKENLVELFNKQLKLIDAISNKFEECYTLASTLDTTGEILQKIWKITNNEYELEPIIRSTAHIKDFTKARRVRIEAALSRLNEPKSLNEIKTISSDIISMQMDHLTSLILADIDPLHADRLNVDHNLWTICSTNMFSDVIQIFFNAVDTQRKIDTMNKLISDESRTKEISILYPTFVDDFKQTTKELLDRLDDSIDLFNEYKGYSKQLYQIYKKYEILK